MAKIKSATTNEAPVLQLPNGRTMRAEAGECLWCGEYVTIGRKEAGATNPMDPCWNVDGDFGCGESPENDEEGTGDHMRPFDLAVRLVSPLPSAVRS